MRWNEIYSRTPDSLLFMSSDGHIFISTFRPSVDGQMVIRFSVCVNFWCWHTQKHTFSELCVRVCACVYVKNIHRERLVDGRYGESAQQPRNNINSKRKCQLIFHAEKVRIILHPLVSAHSVNRLSSVPFCLHGPFAGMPLTITSNNSNRSERTI